MNKCFFICLLFAYGQVTFGMDSSKTTFGYLSYTQPVPLADALAMKMRLNKVEDGSDCSSDSESSSPCELSNDANSFLGHGHVSHQVIVSPEEALSLKSQKNSLKSILCWADKGIIEKKKKRVKWSLMAEKMNYEQEQEYEYSYQEESAGQSKQFAIKTESEDETQSCLKNCLKKNSLSPNSAYRDYINGQIVVAAEEAREKRDILPLAKITQYFCSLLFEAGIDDTERPILEEALEVVAQESRKLSGEPELQEIPECKPALGFLNQSHSVSPTPTNPVYMLVPLLPEASINSRICKVEQQKLIDGEAFEMLFKEAINKKDRGLLEILKSSLDNDSEELQRIEKALCCLDEA